MSKLLVVIGLTGLQGGSVAEVYSNEPGWKVRGISRFPDSAKSLAWKAKGVEVVQCDLSDKASLASAVDGATAIFCNTDFWTPFRNPETASLLKPGQNINEFCYDLEVSHGRNIADAAAAVPTLERFILSTLADAKKASRGKYTWVYHFDSKAHVLDYIRTCCPELARKMSTVQVGAYMANVKILTGIKKQTDGKYRLAMVGSGKKPIPQFDVVRDLGCVVRAALQTPAGANILAAGSTVSWSEVFEGWCEVNGLPCGGFEEIPLETYKKAVTVPGLGEELGEMLAFMDEFGYTGDDSLVSAQDLDVPCPLTSWETFAKESDWSEMLHRINVNMPKCH